MSLLLDTHAFLWWLGGTEMDAAAVSRIGDPDVLVAVSAASIWEIAIKRSIGKVKFEGSAAATVSSAGFESLPVTAEHAERAGALPMHHRDPFDRMLIAQAVSETMTIVTRDGWFGHYDVDVLWC